MVQDSQNTIMAAGNLILDPNGKILLVKETYGKWNFPMGKIEPGENPIQCAEREGNEETGFEVKPSYFIGKYQNPLGENYTITSFIFLSEIIGGELKIPEDILDVEWFSFEEIKELNNKELFIGSYILSAIEDYKKGVKIPLDRLPCALV